MSKALGPGGRCEVRPKVLNAWTAWPAARRGHMSTPAKRSSRGPAIWRRPQALRRVSSCRYHTDCIAGAAGPTQRSIAQNAAAGLAGHAGPSSRRGLPICRTSLPQEFTAHGHTERGTAAVPFAGHARVRVRRGGHGTRAHTHLTTQGRGICEGVRKYHLTLPLP